MSSESISEKNTQAFLWENGLDLEAYVYATYYFETPLPPKTAAIAMAREQSAITVHTDSSDFNIEAHAAKVISVDNLGETTQLLPPYWLNTAGYRNVELKKEGNYWKATTRIAFPLINFRHTVTSLWNVVLGELPRLGFLNAIRLIDLKFPAPFLAHFSGPRYGITGIRKILDVDKRPIFCRSTRPAIGLSVDRMLEIGEKVLKGGFDILKDDELTYSSDSSDFKNRVSKIADLVRRVGKETGERKIYFANVIDDFSQTLELLEIVKTAGAEGVLVSPGIQGASIISEIAKRSELVILAHNTCEDIWTRLPRFGVSPSVVFKVQRLSGADMVILPGNFATNNADTTEMQACIKACIEPMGNIRTCLPIMDGGKQAKDLSHYANSVGSTDFMLIVATAVDEHPDGIEAGAQAFRKAWGQLLF